MIKKISIGKAVKKIFLNIVFDTNLIVVSEKIIIINPIKKVISLSLWYLGLSFEIIINKYLEMKKQFQTTKEKRDE